MADFTADLQNLSRPSFQLPDSIDPNMDSTIFSDSTNIMNCQNFMPFFGDNFLGNQVPDFPEGNLMENFPAVFNQNHQSFMEVSQRCVASEFKKRKAMEVSENSSMNSSPQVSESGVQRPNMNSRRGKKVKVGSEEEEKTKEVVHVRARRGQATDSHSLAERVRRGKINERLKCLRDIVPGCYKTMGMAVMLDEIINYVQSLQNQVEFLSMKLTAASRYYDFNAETDDIETMQRAKAREVKEAKEMRNSVMMMREGGGGYGGGGVGSSSHSKWSHSYS